MAKQTKTILGIDPGIADTGFGVIVKNGHDLICLDYGTIKTKAQLSLPQRLSHLHQQLEKIITKFKPDLIAVEELFFYKNVKTAFMVGQARGVILLTAWQANLKIVEFTPLQVKQAVSNYGSASKQQVQKMVKLLLKLNKLPKPDDAADALAIAICASNERIK